jgi:hypothetical protein
MGWIFLVLCSWLAPATGAAADQPVWYRTFSLNDNMKNGVRVIDWTGGRTVCDPVRSSKLDSGPEGSGEHARLQPLEQAFLSAIGDTETAGRLSERPETAPVATRLAAALTELRDGYLPGIVALNCKGPAKTAAERRELLGRTGMASRAAEAVLEHALAEEDEVLDLLNAGAGKAVAPGGANFWIDARISVNDLSCEILFARKYVEKALASTDESHFLGCNLDRVESESAGIEAQAKQRGGEPARADESDITGLGSH